MPSVAWEVNIKKVTADLVFTVRQRPRVHFDAVRPE
jgi:hypothetical protein